MSNNHHDNEPSSSPVKRLVVLGILIAILVGSLIYGSVSTGKGRFVPDLALDLEGGTQIVLTPISTDGSQVTDQDVNQAIEIIRQRVDASGVAEAEISSQGGSNIVVGLPGNPSQETLDLVRTSAVLRLRPVIQTMSDQPIDSATVTSLLESVGKTPEAKDPQNMTAEELDRNIQLLSDVDGDGTLSSEPAATPENASDPAWMTEQVQYDMYTLQCGSQDERISGAADDPSKPFAACQESVDETTGDTYYTKYLLGPAELEGSNITQASSSLATNQSGTPTGGWAVNIEFDSEGSKIFGDVTERLASLEQPRNLFAIVLDGRVISAAAPSSRIDGGAQITGQFTSEEASALANQLNFGSLPLNFEVQSEEQISATLGTDQLQAGLIAGAIGLLLIVAYMAWQYHALGFVAVFSIVLSTGLSYLIICLLSWLMGYRLSMAGVLGIIISIGMTADSFIVYFERIRDEIRDGRTIVGAVEHGWLRARRTIIISDFVNLLSSVTLYLLTVGGVRGFAFTLGITTVLDLVVVMMFTYPVMQLLTKTSFFGEGKRFSGMDVKALGGTPIYRGRGSTRLARKSEEKSTRRAPKKTRVLSGGVEERELSADEYPDARFIDDETTAKTTQTNSPTGDTDVVTEETHSGESLAKRRARERRERRDSEASQEEGNE